MRTPRYAVLATIVCCFLQHAWAVGASSQESPGPQITPTRRALLIGINDYQSDTIQDLRGPVNDIEVAERVLTIRYGFAPTEIRKLINQSATREGILSALKALAEASGPNDIIYIHYSGHGSQVDDANGDEPDGLDETLVPYDGRVGDIPDITDDELGEFLALFRTPNLVAVLDSCHSGTATRDVSLTMRSIPKDSRANLYKRAVMGTRAVVSLEQGRHLLLSAAPAAQPALDGPIDGEFRGLFSYALYKTLGAAEASAPAEAISRGIDAELGRIKGQFGLVDMPEPQVEGDKKKLAEPLFPFARQAIQAARFPWLAVSPGSKGAVLLKNAEELGATVGSTWLIYPVGELDFVPGSAVATARVSSINAKDAVATLEPTYAVIADGARAIAFAQGAMESEVAVHIIAMAGVTDQPLREALKQQVPGVKFASPEDFARFVIRLDSQRCQVLGAGGLQLLDDFPVTGAAGDMAKRIMPVLRRSATVTELLSLENRASRTQLEARTVSDSTPSPQQEGARGVKAVGNARAARYQVRRDQDPRSPANSLQIEVRSSEDVYLTIVDVDQEGGVNLLFPNEYQKKDYCPEGRIPGQKWIRIPDSTADENQAGFNWDISPPAGQDTIRIFAARSLPIARFIRQYVQNLSRGPTSQKEMRIKGFTFAPLHQELAQVAVSRGIKARPNQPPPGVVPAPPVNPEEFDWTAVAVTIVVSENSVLEERP